MIVESNLLLTCKRIRQEQTLRNPTINIMLAKARITASPYQTMQVRSNGKNPAEVRQKRELEMLYALPTSKLDPPTFPLSYDA